MSNKKILCIISKASSSLDFVIPLIDYCRNNNKEEWHMLFWGEKENIIKGGSFYLDYFDEHKINYSFINDDFRDYSEQKGLLSLLKYQFLQLNLFKKIKARLNIHSDNNDLVDFLFKRYKSDVVFFDHRGVKEHFGLPLFKDKLITSKTKTILFPHAPHHTGTEAFCPFSEQERLPENCDYWMPFIYDQYWKTIPEKKEQFHYSGYPGLDSTWINKWDKPTNPKDKKKLVLIIRKVFNESITENPKGHDNFAFFYNEFKQHLKEVREAIDEVNPSWELHIKPHPANNRKMLQKIINETCLKNTYLNDDCIYNQLKKFDIFLAFYTTTILIPLLAKRPSVIIDSRIQKEINKWESMRSLYEDIQTFASDKDQLIAHLKEINAGFNDEPQLNKILDLNMDHVRKFYPDNASETSQKLIWES